MKYQNMLYPCTTLVCRYNCFLATYLVMWYMMFTDHTIESISGTFYSVASDGGRRHPASGLIETPRGPEARGEIRAGALEPLCKIRDAGFLDGFSATFSQVFSSSARAKIVPLLDNFGDHERSQAELAGKPAGLSTRRTTR